MAPQSIISYSFCDQRAKTKKISLWLKPKVLYRYKYSNFTGMQYR